MSGGKSFRPSKSEDSNPNKKSFSASKPVGKSLPTSKHGETSYAESSRTQSGQDHGNSRKSEKFIKESATESGSSYPTKSFANSKHGGTSSAGSSYTPSRHESACRQSLGYSEKPDNFPTKSFPNSKHGGTSSAGSSYTPSRLESACRQRLGYSEKFPKKSFANSKSNSESWIRDGKSFRGTGDSKSDYSGKRSLLVPGSSERSNNHGHRFIRGETSSSKEQIPNVANLAPGYPRNFFRPTTPPETVKPQGDGRQWRSREEASGSKKGRPTSAAGLAPGYKETFSKR